MGSKCEQLTEGHEYFNLKRFKPLQIVKTHSSFQNGVMKTTTNNKRTSRLACCRALFDWHHPPPSDKIASVFGLPKVLASTMLRFVVRLKSLIRLKWPATDDNGPGEYDSKNIKTLTLYNSYGCCSRWKASTGCKVCTRTHWSLVFVA